MEDISPSLLLLWDVKRALMKGFSLSQGVQNFLQRSDLDSFAMRFQRQVEQWWLSLNNPALSFDKTRLNPSRRYLLEVLESGLRGQGVLVALNALETEMVLSCEHEVQLKLARLPLISLLPLLFFIFPSLMLLLVMPLLDSFRF